MARGCCRAKPCEDASLTSFSLRSFARDVLTCWSTCFLVVNMLEALRVQRAGSGHCLEDGLNVTAAEYRFCTKLAAATNPMSLSVRLDRRATEFQQNNLTFLEKSLCEFSFAFSAVNREVNRLKRILKDVS